MVMTMRERRREDGKEEAPPEPNELPPEIIGEILIRLPAKSIGRFRCVSKLFHSSSSDQRFARRHLDLTVRNFSVRKLLVSSHNLYALDFDSLIGDYKVVKLVAASREDLLSASVYSLKANSWRRICDLRCQHNDGFDSGVNLNGACHWVFRLDRYRRVVLAFDIKTEEFREMPLPEDAEDCPHRFKQLVVGSLNGRLCVVNRCHGVHDDVWVMNEYGVASSWSKIRISLLYKSMKPLCSSTNNSEEVVLQLDEDLVLYNFETNEWRKLGIRGVKLCNMFEACTYVESLVSPNL